MRKKRTILRWYEQRIHPDRENFAILDWVSLASQHARFDALIDNVDLRNKKLLDVGCGLGDLWAYLRARGIPVDYTGVDISKRIIRTAHQRQRGGRFMYADLFAAKLNSRRSPFTRKAFDVAYGSGVFNLNLGNNGQFLPAAIGRMMELAGQIVAFNLLHVRTAHQADVYIYYDPADVIAAIRPLGWEMQLVEGYLPNDFTVICRHPGSPTG